MKHKALVVTVSTLLVLVTLLGSFGCSKPAPAPATTSTPTPAPTAKATPAPTPTPVPSPTAKPTATPAQTTSVRKPEGTVTIATNTLGTESWLPNQGGTSQISIVMSIYDYLVGAKFPSGELTTTGVAEKWELSPDGKDIAFYIRKGIQFHEGYGELTAEDVKFSIELVMNKNSRSSILGTFTQNIASVEVKDPYQVVVHTKNKYSSLLFYLAGIMPGVGIVPKKYVEKVGEAAAGKKPVGSGPYRFVEAKAGTFVKMEALDSHWRKTGEFKTVIQTVVPEASSALAMVKTGAVDIAQLSLPYKKEAQAMSLNIRPQNPDSEVWITLGGQFFPERKGYDINVPWVGPTPERALKVRQALNLAVNKQDIINRFMSGEGEPIGLVASLTRGPWADSAWKPLSYDPDKAKQLLAEAGYPNGFQTTMRVQTYPTTPETADISEAVAMYWEKIGIKVKREIWEYAAQRKAIMDRTTSGAAWTTSMSLKPEPTMCAFLPGHEQTNSVVESKYVDELLSKANAEMDFNKRVAIYRDLGKFLYDGSFVIPIAARKSAYIVSNKVGTLTNMEGWGYMSNYEYIGRK